MILLTTLAVTVSPWLRWPLTVLYLLMLLLICLYGLHKYYLTWLFLRTRHRAPQAGCPPRPLPSVTVQLPMYNEPHVAQRIIHAACALDYPRDLLQIQVLDDSTDQTAQIAEACCRQMRQAGHPIEYHHRPDRSGYKAGALNYGLARARGQLIAVFDADFLPPPDLLKRMVGPFADPTVGAVQARWEHLNRDDSLLTHSQAIFLDGHFVIEHAARNRSGRWMNFNGTAGIWRRQAIEDAGGWQTDTLTEDVDLSYRAQLAGWRFVYLDDVACPGELPPEVNAFKTQQHRWTKGLVQNALKLLPLIFRSKAPWPVKLEAFFHLTAPLVYLYIVIFSLLLFPSLFVHIVPGREDSPVAWVLGAMLFLLGTTSAGTFYFVAQRQRGRSVGYITRHLLPLMAIGIGLSVNNARACFEALFRRHSPFVRTPKYGDKPSNKPAGRMELFDDPVHMAVGLAEIALALYTSACMICALFWRPTLLSVPFLALFAAGYWWAALASLRRMAGRLGPVAAGSTT